MLLFRKTERKSKHWQTTYSEGVRSGAGCSLNLFLQVGDCDGELGLNWVNLALELKKERAQEREEKEEKEGK